MSKRFERNRRFITAVLVAALYRMPSLGFVEFFKVTWAILRAITWTSRGSSRWVYYRRLRHCYRCELFFKPLRTCGSPFMDGYEDLGCFCDMTRKAAVPNATCWADENTDLNIGWKTNGIP